MVYKTLFIIAFTLSFFFGILYLVKEDVNFLILQWMFIGCQTFLILGKGIVGDNFLD